MYVLKNSTFIYMYKKNKLLLITLLRSVLCAKKVMLLLSVFLLMTYVTMFLKFFIHSPESLLSLLVMSNSIFVFTNIWYYFVSIYKWGTYTTSVQRFWKRTFMLFWVIEFFLFFLFLYMWSLSPEETSFFIDSYRQVKPVFIFKKEFLVYINPLCFLIFLWYSLFFFKKNGEFNKLLIFTLFLVCYIFVIELLSFLQLLNFLSKNNFFFIKNTANTNLISSKVYHRLHSLDNLTASGFGNINTTVFSNRTGLSTSNTLSFFSSEKYKLIAKTSIFYCNLITFLKFWHLVFITLASLLTLQKFLFSTNSITMDNISANLQNYVYVLFFFNLNFLFFFKNYFYFFFKYIYFWFYENYSFLKYSSILINEVFAYL